MDPQVRRASRVEYILTCDDGLLPTVELFCKTVGNSADDSNGRCVLLLVSLLDGTEAGVTLRWSHLSTSLQRKLGCHEQVRLWFVCQTEALPQIEILGLYYDRCFIPCV